MNRKPGLSLWTLGGVLLGAVLALLDGGLGGPMAVLVTGCWIYGTLGGLVSAFLQAVPPLRGRDLPRVSALGFVALLVVAAGASAWLTRAPARSEAGADAPDVLLISCDTTRHDRWWAIAEHAATIGDPSAALDRNALRFENAYCPTALTAPSHASLLTGLAPHEHGIRNNGAALGSAVRLPESLRAAGYTTLAAPSVIHLDPGFGFDRGFDSFLRVETGLSGALRPLQRFTLVRAMFRVLGAGRSVRDGEETLAAAQDLWLGAAEARPRFMWAHIFEPHWPYEPLEASLRDVVGRPAWPTVATPGYDEARIDKWRLEYDAEILEARRILYDFVSACQADSAQRGRALVVVFTSDHGESIGEHGVVDHGDLLYEDQVRVPLWVTHSGRELPERESTPVSHLDLFPALAEWLGCELPSDASGRSWFPALSGESLSPVPIYAATQHAAFDNTMVRDGELKLIRNHRRQQMKFVKRPDGRGRDKLEDLPWMGAWEFYDLASDPYEQQPAERPLRTAGPALAEPLEAWDASRGEFDPDQNLTPDVVDSLKELGYF